MNLSKNRRIVFALAAGALLALATMVLALQPGRAAGPWYVTPGGDDGNDCLSPAAPCATINGALGKASSGDTIYVAIGTYTGTGDQVVLLDKDATLSGGWDEAFTTQDGTSATDGEGMRRGMTVNEGVAATVEYFSFQNGYGDPNGGGICSDGILTLNNCTLSGNTSGHMGGAIMILNNGIMSANNCTISGNMAGQSGGGIGKGWGILSLNNCTITGNTAGRDGGGIGNLYYDTVTLQNTIVAGNTAPVAGPDCYSSLISSGYNLIGDTTDCTFTATTGDLTNIDAKLGPLFGPPSASWYHPLLPGSPAVDAGNPTGCTDHLGNPLTTDQRGTLRPLDGDGDGDAICDIGAYELDPEHPIRQAFLPCIARYYCPPGFFDDFSYPASGWDVVDDSYVRTEYLDGEYRVLTKLSGYFYLFKAPSCDRPNYTVEVDVRWDGTPGSSYGLIFGITGGYGQYYLFDVNTDYQMFRLLRRDPSGFVTVVPVTSAPAINWGTASNHLKVTRNGTGITLEVNGTVLGTWYDGTIGGLTGVGVVTNPYSDTPTSDARFDNFSMVTLLGGGASMPDSGTATPEEIEFVAPNARRDPVPAGMAW